MANASGLLILPAAGIRRCDLSFLVHLRSPDPTRVAGPQGLGFRVESLLSLFFGGGGGITVSGFLVHLACFLAALLLSPFTRAPLFIARARGYREVGPHRRQTGL